MCMNSVELRDTAPLMASTDYKDRFLAEYLQLKIRYGKLASMVEAWDAGELNFTPTCPREMYDDQLDGMRMYLDILEERATLEGVDISEPVDLTPHYDVEPGQRLYRKKPVVIRARIATEEEKIETLEGAMTASVGDYVITGVSGEEYPCKPDIFHATYEEA